MLFGHQSGGVRRGYGSIRRLFRHLYGLLEIADLQSEIDIGVLAEYQRNPLSLFLPKAGLLRSRFIGPDRQQGHVIMSRSISLRIAYRAGLIVFDGDGGADNGAAGRVRNGTRNGSLSLRPRATSHEGKEHQEKDRQHLRTAFT